eukprot:14147256-Alexandrium_andersonii.AAC.1
MQVSGFRLHASPSPHMNCNCPDIAPNITVSHERRRHPKLQEPSTDNNHNESKTTRQLATQA